MHLCSLVFMCTFNNHPPASFPILLNCSATNHVSMLPRQQIPTIVFMISTPPAAPMRVSSSSVRPSYHTDPLRIKAALLAAAAVKDLAMFPALPFRENDYG